MHLMRSAAVGQRAQKSIQQKRIMVVANLLAPLCIILEASKVHLL